MNTQALSCLQKEFIRFLKFAPKRQCIIFSLMLFQGLTAGIGLLFIIPLLQIVGIDIASISNVESTSAGVSKIALSFFEYVGLEVDLVNILMSYVLIVTVISSLRYFLAVLSTTVQQQYICHLRNTLYRSLLHSSWQFITKNKMSDFSHSLSGQVQAIGHASQLMLTFMSQIVLSLVLVSMAFVLSWEMSILALFFAIVLLALLMPLNRVVYNSGNTHLVSFKYIFQMLSEHLGSLKMIKGYASESYHAQKLQSTSEILEAQNIKLAKVNALTQWIYMVTAVVAFSVFFYVALQVLSIPVTTILLLLLIFSRILPQISGIQKTYQQLLQKVPAFNDVNQMVRELKGVREPNTEDTPCPILHNRIRITELSYQHPGKKHAVFSHLSVDIKRNQTVALVGPSGAGKSTLADLISGLLEPTSGEIYCDDIALTGKHRLAWRQGIAYVTQEVYLFHDTIRANLSWVSNEPQSDEDLWSVLKQASADTFVQALPDGLDTIIGDQGIRLSGGERQRLALARALLSKPQLLILDEATSALDLENERKIQKTLKNLYGQLTILIITHKETVSSLADKVIEIPMHCKLTEKFQLIHDNAFSKNKRII